MADERERGHAPSGSNPDYDPSPEAEIRRLRYGRDRARAERDAAKAAMYAIAEARRKDGETIGELRAALTKIAMGVGMPQHVEESLADAEIRQLARDVLERTKP